MRHVFHSDDMAHIVFTIQKKNLFYWKEPLLGFKNNLIKTIT